jgi:hypothetical protein
MSSEAELKALEVPVFDPDSPAWHHLGRDPAFDYAIDYWYAVIDAEPERIRFVMRWEPNAYCHFHRHVARTTTLVLAGEHHLIETTPTQIVHKTRLPGHYVQNLAGDVHMEHGGPAGSTVLFAIEAPDGRMFEVLDKEGNVLAVSTIESFMAPVRARAALFTGAQAI